MKHSYRTFWAALLAAALLAFSLAPAHAKGPKARQATSELYQVGVIDALLAGAYGGSQTLGTLRGHGTLGLGTFDGLDGEMVVLDGVVYQVPFDGVVRRPAMGVTTPFAQVVRFRPEGAASLPAASNLKALEAALDAAITAKVGDLSRFAAVRLDADFASLTARSVPRQSPPFRPLAEVAKGQAVFRFEDVRGTLVGLRGPDFVRGLGVPGWHWHFLTQDRTRGGHVLDCTLASGAEVSAPFQTLRAMSLHLPKSGLSGMDLGRDRTGELKAVESSK